jgi:hypothetical protein
MAVIRYAQKHGTRSAWLVAIDGAPADSRSPPLRLPTKIARMAWAIMVRGEQIQGAGCCGCLKRSS